MRTYSLAALALAFVAFSSCTLNVATSDLNDTDTLAGFQGSYMTTFEILNGSFLPADRAFSPFNKAIQSAASKATAPMWSTTSYSLPTAVGATTNGSLAN